ncbi:MAG: hypothetical protein LUD84_00685 [Clostridiales bacterium]|nr:hypothetical protein [Clostridiales bacterium]
MEKRCVLFSPIGMTDPIKEHKDGPLLHIIRYYHPEAVTLFLTSEIMEIHQRDDRYRRTADAIQPGIQWTVLEHPEIKQAQQFEIYDEPFRAALEDLHNRYPEHEVLVNISSGTPQMQASLYLLSATMPFAVTPVQVSTPAKSSNYGPRGKTQHFTTVEEELSRLNETGADTVGDKRAARLHLHNLQATILKKNIVSQLQTYNYPAAASLMESAPELFTVKAQFLCTAAKLRLSLQTEDAHRTAERTQLPALFSLPGHRLEPLYENILTLDILLKRGACGDYARAVSPAITTMMEAVAFRWLGKGKDVVCCQDRAGIYRWDLNRLRQNTPELLDYFNRQFHGSFRGGAVNAAGLLNVLRYCRETGYPQANEKDLQDFEDLRRFEEKVRNFAAHQITAIDAGMIRAASGMEPENVRDILHRQFERLCDKPVPWDDYDRMNRALIAELDRK